jgi:PadR family transcriptional regulator, regulatory protein PadR
MNRERLKGHLDLLLMSVLAAGPAHGYAILASLRERRVYALTDKGVAALAAERSEWRRFAAGVQAVLGWSV